MLKRNQGNLESLNFLDKKPHISESHILEVCLSNPCNAICV